MSELEKTDSEKLELEKFKERHSQIGRAHV